MTRVVKCPLDEVSVVRGEGAYDRIRGRTSESNVHAWFTTLLGEAPSSRGFGADSEGSIALVGANLRAHRKGLGIYRGAGF